MLARPLPQVATNPPISASQLSNLNLSMPTVRVQLSRVSYNTSSPLPNNQLHQSMACRQSALETLPERFLIMLLASAWHVTKKLVVVPPLLRILRRAEAPNLLWQGNSVLETSRPPIGITWRPSNERAVKQSKSTLFSAAESRRGLAELVTSQP